AVQRFRSNNLRSSIADDDLDDDIAPTVTEMDMLEDQELDEQPSAIIPRRGGLLQSYSTRGNNPQIRRNIPPPPRLYPRSE
ncbi:unnamed protein product, partial [Rotaria magnacalcarata]